MRIDFGSRFRSTHHHSANGVSCDYQRSIVYCVNPQESLLEGLQKSSIYDNVLVLPFESFHEFISQYDCSSLNCVLYCCDKYDSVASGHVAKIFATYQSARVAVIVQNWQIASIVRAIRDGVAEVFGSDTDWFEIESTIQRLHREDANNRSKLSFEIPENILDMLTSEEARIFDLLLQGRTTKQVGSELDLSVRTIHYRKKSLFEKLGVSNRLEAVEVVRRMQRKQSQDKPLPVE